MLTATKKYGSLALTAVVSTWLVYVAVGSTSFQICMADKENKQSEQASKKNSPEVLRSLIESARVKTDCAFVFLYDSRDAVTAIATVFIALFTLTLWRSTISNADAFMNSEGAQLWMDEMRIHGIRTSPAALKLSYVIRNFGSSPGWVHHKPVRMFTGNVLPKTRNLVSN
jgi:hypothetical protein